MKKYLFCNYYSDKNPKRRDELLICLNSNVMNPVLDKVIVFYENNDCEDLEPDDKIVLVKINKRLEFRDVFEYVLNNIEDDAVIIIANLDIFLETSMEWHTIEHNFFNLGYKDKALVCCRYNLDKDYQVWFEEKSWTRGEFCDAWVFKTPLKEEFLKEDFNFCVGNAPQCDNTMMYLMDKHYHTYSWGEKYKVYHLDNARKKAKKTKLIFTDKTDLRAAVRKKEHISISAYQDWDSLLVSSEKPQAIPSWRIIYKNKELMYQPI